MSKIVHLITGLNSGGAEMALYNRLEGLSVNERVQHRVISLINPAAVGDRIMALGIPVMGLGLVRGLPTPMAIWRLVAELRRERGWHIHAVMYHANLLATLVCLLLLKPRNHIWEIHNSLTHMQREKRLTRWVIRALALLSFLPQQIVYVASSSARQHEAVGYLKARSIVIPNGLDVDAFQPGSDAALRALVPTQAKLIGLITRWDWTKDHAMFFAALAQVPEAHAVLISPGMEASNAELMTLIRKHGVEARVHLLGYRNNTRELIPGFDLFCLSSVTESLPIALGEAMACGVPAVVTDVGDAAVVVGDTGWVVPPQNPAALATALNTALLSDYKSKGLAARARITENYTQQRMLAAYRQLYSGLCWTGDVR